MEKNSTRLEKEKERCQQGSLLNLRYYYLGGYLYQHAFTYA